MATLLTKRAIRDELTFVEDRLREHSDPYDTVGFMWRQRRDALLAEIGELQSSLETTGEVALLFDDGPVHGSEDIRLNFSTKILENYQGLISTIAGESSGASLPKGFTSHLFIKDMLRGSVGFLLQEAHSDQASLLPTAVKDAIDAANTIFENLSSPDPNTFQESVDKLSGRTVSAIKKVAKTLNDAGATAKVVSTDREVRLSHDRVATLHSRLNEVEVIETSEQQDGTLLGVFPARKQFEFRIGDDGPVIHGELAEELLQQYVSNSGLAELLLKPVTARFLVITKMRSAQLKSEERILEGIAKR